MKLILVIIAFLMFLSSALPLIPREEWWIRVFDFPRAQILTISLFVLVGLLFFRNNSYADSLILILLMLAVIYQVYMILPYTSLARKQVLKASGNPTHPTVSLLIANVLMRNRQVDLFLPLVRETNPDLILILENDLWWDRQLRSHLRDYIHQVLHPQENTYGIALHSRLSLIRPEIRFLVDDVVPSIRTGVQLRDGSQIRLHCLHPRPPHPVHGQDTTERDAELVLVGREVRDSSRPAIVAGDLNDVAWSHTTRLFQRISGLLDPRVGRGLFSTFHARYPFLRWPLDHLFHSKHFRLVEIRRLSYFGSDHFPVFVHLSFEPEIAFQQDEPQMQKGDRKEAREAIQKVR